MTSKEITLPEKIAILEDTKSKVKTIATSFDFPDGTKGILMISHLSKGDWNPGKDIKSIILNFHEDNSSTR